MYECNICFKTYKHRQSLYTHKKKCEIVNNDSNINENTNTSTFLHNETRNYPHFLDNTYTNPQNHSQLHNDSVDTDTTVNNEDIEVNNKLQCEYCNKILSRIDSLKRHYKTCKKKQEMSNTSNSSQGEIYDFEQLREEMLQIINKMYKVHPKTFEKMQRTLKNINIENQNNIETQNNNTQNINTQNNNTQNINVNIIPLGKEDFVNTLSEEMQLNIIKNSLGNLTYFIDKTHFNPDTPQYKSFAITNTQNNIAYVYDDETKGFKATTKNLLMFNLYHERGCDIRDMIEVNKDKLKDFTVKKLIEFVNKLDTDAIYLKKKSNELKAHIYNKTKSLDFNEHILLNSQQYISNSK
jgi:hypothetical protein